MNWARRSKRWLVYGAGSALVVTAVSVSIRQLRGPDYLSKADAYAKLGQLDSVVALIERHVLRHPTDLGTRLRYGELVLGRGDTAKAVRVLEEVIRDAAGKDSIRRDMATRLVVTVARSQGESADSLSDLFLQRAMFDSTIYYANVAARQFMEVRSLNVQLGDTANFTRWIDNLRISWAAARQVMASHLRDRGSPEPYSLMAQTPVLSVDAVLWDETLRRVQRLLDSIADVAFTARSWSQAERHYLSLRVFSGLRRDSAEEARALYNAATADWNDGRFSAAERLLRTVRDSFPFYEQAHVVRSLKDAPHFL